MRSRMVREGSVGLLILAGLGLFAGVVMWQRGIQLSKQSYTLTLLFESVVGMDVGTPVRYRGVQVGRIVATRPGPNGVEVEVSISPPDLIIPKDVKVEANQSGLLGATAIDITAVKDLQGTVSAKPLDKGCDSNLILCHKAQLPGGVGVSVDELIRSSVQFTTAYSDPQFLNNVNAVAQNSAEAAKEVAKLSREFGVLARVAQGQVTTFAGAAQSANSAANQISLTAGQVNDLLTTNRATLVGTLNNINALTGELRTTVATLNPAVSQLTQGEILRNLETLSANAAQASANLRDASQALNSPTNLASLQQTLDSARATFQNVQKISSDLDELTGDPQFRTNLRNLVTGLSGLVSSTQQLQQQAQLAQVLPSLATSTATASLPTAPLPTAPSSPPVSATPVPAAPAPALTRTTPPQATRPTAPTGF
jgi:phospholipid/cholesterol/gamma-HCH transport system substrate-binding protein